MVLVYDSFSFWPIQSHVFELYLDIMAQPRHICHYIDKQA